MAESEIESEENLLARHRNEKKQLQAHIQQLKKSVNNNKKKKKETLKEISDQEEALIQRHTRELQEYKLNNGNDELTEINIITNEIDCLNVDEEPENSVEHEDDAVETKRISKGERRRQKKVEANKKREVLIQEEIANSKFSARNIEADKLKQLLASRNYKMFEIEPDGNCMFAAISHQIQNKYSVQNLRSQAAIHMRENYGDFAPFLTHTDTGDMMTAEEFNDYCDTLENTSTWGGEPELMALSQCLKRKFEVIQAEGAPRLFGEEFQSEGSVLLPYYRHYYGLGEHYNSAVSIIDKEKS